MSTGKTFALIFIISTTLTGCGPSQQEIWQSELSTANVDAHTAVKRLGSRINKGLVSNTKKLVIYAATVKDMKPETFELVTALAEDATTKGPIYQSLLLRLKEASSEVASAPGAGSNKVNKLLFEFKGIEKASSSTLYNMMLTDPINVLADMSNNKLARLESQSAEASSQLGQSENMGPGNQMVGNPHYGRWRADSSGNSFWAFYGRYAMMSHLFGGGYRTYYGSWSSRRPYSYYHDYGRSTYSSPGQRASQQSLQTKTASKFKSQGKTFKSPYARKRATTRSVASKTSAATKSFNSSYAARSSARSSSGGSLRSGSSRTSRSRRGGK